jgi:phosphoserine phosphatase
MKKFAIYDFDGTLLQTQTVPLILRHWGKSSLPKKLYNQLKRQIIFRYILVKSKVFGLNYDQFRYWSMGKVGLLLTSIPLNQLQIFLDSLYLASKKYLHKTVLQHLKKDKKHGYQTVLLSGNFDIFLERFRELGFDFIYGTSLFNIEGKMNQPLHILSADRKLPTMVTELPQIDWGNSKAYTDSFIDLALLKKVKEPICVTPDRRLLTLAEANHWQVIL